MRFHALMIQDCNSQEAAVRTIQIAAFTTPPAPNQSSTDIEQSKNAWMCCHLLIRSNRRTQMRRIKSISQHPPRLVAAGVLLFVALATACRAPQTTEQQTQVPAAPHVRTQELAMDRNSPSSAESDPASALDAAVRKGMAYADFRKQALRLGWEPAVDPQCNANVAGADHAALCARNPDLTECKICNELPELSSCSSDAHCLVRFRHPDSGQVLEATGYGEVKYWKESGDDAGLQVSGWEFTGGAADK